MDIRDYQDRPNRLLVEIGFMGAQYGLTHPTISIVKHLSNQEETRAASLMIAGVLQISMRNYPEAQKAFQTVFDTESYKVYHPQAKELLAFLAQKNKS